MRHLTAKRLGPTALVIAALIGCAGCIGDGDGGMDDEDTGDAGEPDDPDYPAYPEQDAGKAPTPTADAAIRDAASGRDAASDTSTPAMDTGAPSLEAGVEAGADAAEAADAALDAGTDAAPMPALGDTYGITSAGRLVLFERQSGRLARSVKIEGLSGETILGADVRPADGALYVLSSTATLYTVDLDSGMATRKASLMADASDTSDPYSALAGQRFGVDFNPVVDRLRVVSDAGQNLRVNVDTGATLSDGALTPTSPGVRAAAYTNSFATACRTRLFVIDAIAGKLLLQDPPNDGRLGEIGALGADGKVEGFDIASTADGATRALVSISRGHATFVAEVNLESGSTSVLSRVALDTYETLDHVLLLPPATPPAQARGELLAISEGHKLISFNRAAPAKLCSTQPITGLGAEAIVGADIRPADGALYALTRTGKLYTLALDTAAASLKSTLTADANDTSDPFLYLEGDAFGVGFNPVPDRLRILSTNGQNLRVNVDTGATTSDAPLSPEGARISALGYTNSFAGARSTTLYALDTGSRSLVRVGGNPASGGGCPADVNNPNCGVVTAVGSLNPPALASALDGFDIDPLTGTAFAAMSLGGAASSSLYSVDLSSGAASALGLAIGGGERVLALMLAASPTLRAFALSSDDKLLSFAPATPGTPIARLALSGLTAGEKLLGIDVRPLDAQLYTVSNRARLLRVDRSTGALTEVATLRAPDGSPIGLPEASFGLDFNPAVDALRLIASSGENYRVLPSARATGAAGTTLVDTALSGWTTPRAHAAAYTNNVAGTPSTSLYVIDGASLSLQGGANGTPSPNSGVLSVVGTLGVSAWGEVGFDIVGAHNGLALASLGSDGTSFKLYTLNLGSGAATPFNAPDVSIDAGGASVTGLTLALLP